MGKRNIIVGESEFSNENERKQFARSVNKSVSLINDLEEITNLNIKNSGKFIRNDVLKYCGKKLYGGDVWFGIRDFSTCQLTLGFLESYDYKGKSIQLKLVENGFTVDVIDTPLDKGHWIYVNFESICCFKNDEKRKKEIESIILEIKEK